MKRYFTAFFILLLSGTIAFAEGSKDEVVPTKLDEDIKREIVDELYWDSRVDASDISVVVTNGILTLSGTVPTFYSKNVALALALEAPGVKNVINKLAVSYTRPVLSDEGLRTIIVSMLELNSYIKASEINVSLSDGVVVLEGTVDTLWKKIRVAELVADIIGVVDIENKISVVPTESIIDATIANRITYAINRNVNVNVDDITVVVKDGVVTLTGSVSKWAARMAAYNVALHLIGVREVNNHIAVEPNTILKE
jgi:osmotically-inducible protein OsmY